MLCWLSGQGVIKGGPEGKFMGGNCAKSLTGAALAR